MAKRNSKTTAASDVMISFGRGTDLSQKTRARHPVTGCRAYSIVNCTWLMDPDTLNRLTQQALSFNLTELMKHRREAALQLSGEPSQSPQRKGYTVKDGVAVVDVSGPITKYETSFAEMMGGTSALAMQKTFKMMLADADVQKIMIRLDSPGGTTDGLFDLAEIVARADKIKPVYALCEDQATSGAYLLASQCRKIYANPNCVLGSIGTMTMLVDTSEKFQKEGIKVIPIVSGKLKGTGMPGVAPSDAQIQARQDMVDGLNHLFLQKVSQGRGISQKEIAALDAGVFVAAKAKDLNLIDGIGIFDDILRTVQEDTTAPAGSDKRGPDAELDSKTAPRSQAMPFTAQQMEQVRKLPGAASVTEANAESFVLDLAVQQNAKVTDLTAQVTALQGQVPVKIDASIAKGHVQIAGDRIGILGEKGVMLPAQIEAFRPQIKEENVRQDGTVMVPLPAVLQVLEMNKPAGVVGTTTSAQPVVRQEPGKEGDEPKQVSEARATQLLNHVGVRRQAAADNRAAASNNGNGH